MALTTGKASLASVTSKYDKWVEDNAARSSKVEVTQAGLTVVVHPDVFVPNITYLIMDVGAMIYPLGGSMLEVGSGCGVLAIHAAKAGVARVLATDIVPACMDCIAENVELHGVQASVQWQVSDVFAGICETDTDKFDVIFWNYPFIPDNSGRTEISNVEKGIRDPGQQCLRAYCQEARQFLQPGGKLFVTFSQTLGDMAMFTSIMNENNWTPRLHYDFGSASDCQVQLWLLEDTATCR